MAAVRGGESVGQRVGDSERLGVGESVGHGDVRVRESARRERVGESRRRVGNALFSVTPLTRSVSGECVGVWRMSMPMRFGDALLREWGGGPQGAVILRLWGSSASLMRRGLRAEAADGSDVDWRDVTNL